LSALPRIPGILVSEFRALISDFRFRLHESGCGIFCIHQRSENFFKWPEASHTLGFIISSVNSTYRPLCTNLPPRLLDVFFSFHAQGTIGPSCSPSRHKFRSGENKNRDALQSDMILSIGHKIKFESEARNPKQIQIFKNPNVQNVLDFGHSDFLCLFEFGFKISDLFLHGHYFSSFFSANWL